MASASLPPPVRDRRDTPNRRRAAAIVLAAVVHLLMLLALLRITPDVIMDMARSGGAITVDLLPDPDRDARDARKATPAARRARAAPPAAAAAPRPTPAEQAPVMPRDNRPLDIIPLTSRDFAAGDISGLPNRRAASAGDGERQADAAGGGKGKGTRGPGGEQLYNADWYRRPTSAELSFYLPKNRRIVGWGEIACRTVAGYRVEDCVLVDEAPAGSGLGRAVLNAAWQFRVLPPRIGGRALVGTWVRIRIEYSEGGATPAD